MADRRAHRLTLYLSPTELGLLDLAYRDALSQGAAPDPPTLAAFARELVVAETRRRARELLAERRDTGGGS